MSISGTGSSGLLLAREPAQLFSQAVRTAGAFPFTSFLDCRNSRRILIRVVSTLDQDLIVQLQGSFVDSVAAATDINGPFACPAGGIVDIGLAEDDWHPYIGGTMTLVLVPTVGDLTVFGVKQE